jgi:hypothetical protein
MPMSATIPVSHATPSIARPRSCLLTETFQYERPDPSAMGQSRGSPRRREPPGIRSPGDRTKDSQEPFTVSSEMQVRLPHGKDITRPPNNCFSRRLLKRVQMSRDFAGRHADAGVPSGAGSRRTGGMPQRVTKRAGYPSAGRVPADGPFSAADYPGRLHVSPIVWSASREASPFTALVSRSCGSNGRSWERRKVRQCMGAR